MPVRFRPCDNITIIMRSDIKDMFSEINPN